MANLLRHSYSLLIYLLLAPVCIYFFWRSRKDRAYRQRMSERFALQHIPQQALGGIVVHAVSVGEVVAATPLINALQLQYPHLPITVTCTTPTGSARIKQTFGDSIYHCYLPFDTPGSVKRWLTKLQPQALIILETELWPNLLLQCRQRLIPTIVVNARLSARSARGYRHWYWLSRLALDNISLLLAQNSATMRRFAALGCTGTLAVSGNLKFDMALPARHEVVVGQYTKPFSTRQVWVAGSTHVGEDEILIDAYQQIKALFPSLLLVLVPRHPERFDTVAEQVKNAGLTLATRSSNAKVDDNIDVLLGDSMGELLAWYQLADVVFIGGSVITRGGHNPLEAMYFGKPIQSGRNVFNFAQAYQWLEKAGAVNWVDDVSTLVANTSMLLQQPAMAAAQGKQALALYRQHSGVAAGMCQTIAAYLGPDCDTLRVRLQQGQVSWYQADVFEQPEQLSFVPAYWQQQQAIIGQSQGRNTAWFIRHNHHDFVLRHYYRGGLIGKLIQDKFSYQSVLHSRAMQEFSLLQHMRRCNLPVPRPLAANYHRAGWYYRSDLMIELIADSQDLATLLAKGQGLTDEQWRQAGAMIADFHQHGVYHSDLNCHNILLDSQGTFWLIDFDKCELRSKGNWQQSNLDRLLRSLQKEVSLHHGFNWQLQQWQSLLLGYNRQFAEEKR